MHINNVKSAQLRTLQVQVAYMIAQGLVGQMSCGCAAVCGLCLHACVNLSVCINASEIVCEWECA